MLSMMEESTLHRYIAPPSAALLSVKLVKSTSKYGRQACIDPPCSAVLFLKIELMICIRDSEDELDAFIPPPNKVLMLLVKFVS